MELRQLRYFAAVAEHEHVTRAAESLYVSQPALSQQIASLERELGTPLFDRIGRGVELTSAGRVLLEHARRILREVENARAAMDDLRGTVRGELSVATIQTANASLLVDALARFRARHPGVIVRVREERAAGVLDAVRRGEANLGVTYLEAERPEDVEAVPLYTEELVLVVPRGHPLAGASVAAREVAGLPLVIPPGGYCLRGGIDAVLAEAGGRQTVAAELTSIEGICDAVRSGLGVSILPARYVLPRAGALGLAVAWMEPVPRRVVGAVRSAGRHACLATRAFLGALSEAAREEAEALSA